MEAKEKEVALMREGHRVVQQRVQQLEGSLKDACKASEEQV